jgi:hypothetical protein
MVGMQNGWTDFTTMIATGAISAVASKTDRDCRGAAEPCDMPFLSSVGLGAAVAAVPARVGVRVDWFEGGVKGGVAISRAPQ